MTGAGALHRRETKAEDPFFSVIVSTYNRAKHVRRCVWSVITQTFTDFEIVVVDDGSDDATATVLAALQEPRLRVARHPHNRGISAARATGVSHARGEWFVILDSDWELFPHTLARLRTLIAELPAGVRIIRSRLQCDDGSVLPDIMPTGVTGYQERLRWMEEVLVRNARSDAGHCLHKSVFEKTNYFDNRRGAVEMYWEANLARHEPSLWVADILGKEHFDAPNSYSREVQAGQLVPRLLKDAPDELWMAESMLSAHGSELLRYAPRVRVSLMRRAATQAFLSGDRRAGLRHTVAAMRGGSFEAKMWLTAGLGFLGPRALGYAKVVGRRQRSVRARGPILGLGARRSVANEGAL